MDELLVALDLVMEKQLHLYQKDEPLLTVGWRGAANDWCKESRVRLELIQEKLGIPRPLDRRINYKTRLCHRAIKALSDYLWFARSEPGLFNHERKR